MINANKNTKVLVGLKALTPQEEFEQYVYQEFEDIKQEIRELRIKIDEVLDQVA